MWRRFTDWLRWLLDLEPVARSVQPPLLVSLASFQDDWAARLLRDAKEAERRLFTPTAFWLHPDRWEGIQQHNLRDPGAVPFWCFDRPLPNTMNPALYAGIYYTTASTNTAYWVDHTTFTPGKNGQPGTFC